MSPALAGGFFTTIATWEAPDSVIYIYIYIYIIYVNHELQLFKLVLEKAEEPEIKLPTSAGSSKKQESARKIFVSALLTMPKPLTVWITINCGKF